jgi:hypothetical protein
MVMQMSRSNQPLPQPQRRAPIQRPQVDDVGSRGRQLLILVLASLVGLIVWASTSQAAPSRTPADAGRAYLREGHYHLEAGSNRTCEDLRCGTTLTQDACDACSLYRQTMSSENLQHVDFSGILIERGVALRATSRLPEIQAQLFAVAVARNDILQQVHEGGAVDLCEPCDANARTFLDVQFAVERIPEGVILSYTSSRDDLVELLQVMLLNGSEQPL